MVADNVGKNVAGHENVEERTNERKNEKGRTTVVHRVFSTFMHGVTARDDKSGHRRLFPYGTGKERERKKEKKRKEKKKQCFPLVKICFKRQL